MNLLTKTLGKSGKLTVDISPAGIEVKLIDPEKLSTNSIDEVINFTPVVQEIEKLLGGGTLVTSGGNALIAELQALAAKV